MAKNKSLYFGFLVVLAIGTALYTITGQQLAKNHADEPKIDFTIVGRGTSLHSVITAKRRLRLLKSADKQMEFKSEGIQKEEDDSDHDDDEDEHEHGHGHAGKEGDEIHHKEEAAHGGHEEI